MSFFSLASSFLRFTDSSLRRLTVLVLAVLLTACGGGNDAPAHYPIGGSVSGLAGGTLVLQVNDGETVSLSADGTFQFPSELPGGTAYVVSVQTQPNNPAQTCSVNRGSGTLNAAVNDITVRCATNAYRIGGTVSGLAGQGLVLQNNGGDDLAIDADGGFRFTQPVASGAAYVVTVRSQPDAPAQTCTVNQSSTIVADTNVTDVRVQCDTNSYPVGGSVSGLGSSGGLVLQNNGTDDLGIDGDGDFQFQKPVASGAGYTVTVRKQPSGQVCSVEQGSGTIGNAGVTDVQVECSTAVHAVKVTVSGYSGSGLTLQNNGGDALYVEGNGSVSFPTPVAFGKSYEVTIASQPSGQFCSVSNGSGTIGDADVTNVQVTCNPSTFHLVNFKVTGLSWKGANLVLQNNGGDDLATNADGSFAFPSRGEIGRPYKVTIKYQPRLQDGACTVSNGSGTVTGDVGGIVIDCSRLEMTKRVAYVSSAKDANSGTVTPYTIGTGDTLASGDAVTFVGNSLSRLVADPQRRFAYVASSEGIHVSQIDPATGGLMAGTLVANLAPNATRTLAMHPGGRFLYLVDSVSDPSAPGLDSSTVSVFQINRDTGALIPKDSLHQDTGTNSLVIDPTGRFLYLAQPSTSSISVFAIDESRGGLEWIGSSLNVGYPVHLAITPNGRFLQVGESLKTSSYTINPGSGVLSKAGETPTEGGNSIASLEMDPAGNNVYVGRKFKETNGTFIGLLYTISAGGTLVDRWGFTITNAANSWAVDPGGHLLLQTTDTDNRIFPYTIRRDSTDGSVTDVTQNSSTPHDYPISFITILGW